MRAAFDMSFIPPVEALIALDLMSIPEADTNCITYSHDSINVAFEFYGNSKEDIYEGCTKISPPILNCTMESLQLGYTGYKSYICTHCLELVVKISGLEKNIKSCLALTEAKKIQITKNYERKRKRITSNPRKEAITTNS